MQTITWLAAADARGHLVRAHVMRQLLAAYDIDVRIFTTSQQGVDFLSQFGTPAELLGTEFRVEFDTRQNVDLLGTSRRAVRYLANPNQFLDDIDRLREVAHDSACLVNDFHPALLVGGWLRPDDLPVVHLYGSNLWRSIARPVRRPAGRWVNPLYEQLVARLRSAGLARIVHRPLAPFEANWTGPSRVELPPLVPGQTPEGGWSDETSGPRVAVYLNPHFRDPAVADAIESTLDRIDARLHAVGEGFAARDRWMDCDPTFASRVADADLLISAPGMGAVGMARTYRTPLLMVRTDQPEQQRNARRLLEAEGTPPCSSVDLESRQLERVLTARANLLLESRSDDAPSRLDAVHGAWRRAFIDLVGRLDDGRLPAAA